MKIYLADTGNMFRVVADAYPERTHSTFSANGNVFAKVNILQSFYYCDSFTEQVIIPNAKSFLLDSGAFTVFSKGGGDWDKYIERYAAFINRNKIDRFFELDIDSLVGYATVLKLRDKLERMTGKRVIPVWHYGRGTKEFHKMCEEYDYVAIGGVVSGDGPKNFTDAFPTLIKIAHSKGCRIHGLGFTNLSLLPKYHFDTVDSSSWTSGSRYATVYIFDNGTFRTVKPKPGQRSVDYKGLTKHNWNEWVKFQKWAEAHL